LHFTDLQRQYTSFYPYIFCIWADGLVIAESQTLKSLLSISPAFLPGEVSGSFDVGMSKMLTEDATTEHKGYK